MSKLPHYLKAERKRASLTQADVAALFGIESASKISRYERGTRLPTLKTALAYEAIFGQPVASLFAGTFHKVRAMVVRHARRLAGQVIAGRKPSFLARRRESLDNITSR
jgi:transcriptional regulator with XRE-family HTH domain